MHQISSKLSIMNILMALRLLFHSVDPITYVSVAYGTKDEKGPKHRLLHHIKYFVNIFQNIDCPVQIHVRDTDVCVCPRNHSCCHIRVYIISDFNEALTDQPINSYCSSA